MKRSQAYNIIRANIKLDPEIEARARQFQNAEITWSMLCDFIAAKALEIMENDFDLLQQEEVETSRRPPRRW